MHIRAHPCYPESETMRTEDGTLGQRPESLMYNPERSSLSSTVQAECKQIQAQQGKPWKTLEKLHSRDWPAPNSVDF